MELIILLIVIGFLYRAYQDFKFTYKINRERDNKYTLKKKVVTATATMTSNKIKTCGGVNATGPAGSNSRSKKKRWMNNRSADKENTFTHPVVITSLSYKKPKAKTIHVSNEDSGLSSMEGSPRASPIPRFKSNGALYKKMQPLILPKGTQDCFGFPIKTEDNFVFFNIPRVSPSYNVHAKEFIPRSATPSGSSSSEEDDEFDNKKCVRCSKFFKVDKPKSNGMCTFHWGRFNYYSGVWNCCEGLQSESGCTVNDVHVWNGYEAGINGPVGGYVETQKMYGIPPGVYALDCEMCYTSAGMELTRITVVDENRCIAYESYVLPENPIIDYNTRFSGITADCLRDAKNLKEVQRDIVNFICADSIVIGHSIDSDLRALKLIHKNVIDTSIMFMGKHKRSLKFLSEKYLNRRIQDNPNGHSSEEDAVAALDLVLHVVNQCSRSDSSMKDFVNHNRHLKNM